MQDILIKIEHKNEMYKNSFAEYSSDNSQSNNKIQIYHRIIHLLFSSYNRKKINQDHIVINLK
jgi:hypothetical protein